MIYVHKWKCQYKNNCKDSYMEGYLAKLLFKRIIISSGIFDSEIPNFKSILIQEK